MNLVFSKVLAADSAGHIAGMRSARFLCCKHNHKSVDVNAMIKHPVIARPLHHTGPFGFQFITLCIIRRLFCCVSCLPWTFSCDYRHKAQAKG